MRRAREPVFILLLYLAVAAALGNVDYRIRGSDRDARPAQYIEDVVSGKEGPPGRYRVLAPFAVRALTNVTHLNARDGYVLFRWLSLVCALAAAHLYFRTWFPARIAVAGTLLMAVLLPLTFTNSWALPDHLPELCLFTLACACIARRWTWTFAAVLTANAFNRETSVFLLPLFLLAQPLDRRRALSAAALGALWLAVYAGLRWRLGLQLYDPWQVSNNMRYLFASGFTDVWDWYYRWGFAWFGVIMIAPLVWMVAASWADLPRFARVAAAVVAPMFLVTALLFSSIIETRMLTPLLPLLLPAALFALFGADARVAGAARGR